MKSKWEYSFYYSLQVEERRLFHIQIQIQKILQEEISFTIPNIMIKEKQIFTKLLNVSWLSNTNIIYFWPSENPVILNNINFFSINIL